MARLPYPDPTHLPPETRKTLVDLHPHNIYKMLAHSPAQLRPFVRLGSANFVQLELPGRLREVAILATARATDARYEWAHHVPIARACDVEEETIRAIETGDMAALSDLDAAVAAFAQSVTRNVRADDAAFEAVHRQLGERQTVELLLVVGYYNMVARFLETMDVDVEPDYERYEFR